jgi:hypothetical protein
MKAPLIAIAIASATLIAGCSRADGPTERSDAPYGSGASSTGPGLNENLPDSTLDRQPAPGAVPGTTTAPDGTMGTDAVPPAGTLSTDPTLEPGVNNGAPTGAGAGTSTMPPRNDIPDTTGTTTRD